MKKYSAPDIEQKFEARETALDREIARQLDKAQKIDQLMQAVKQNFPSLYTQFEYYVRPPAPVRPVVYSAPSTPASSSARARRESTPNSARSTKPTTPNTANGARSHRSNA